MITGFGFASLFGYGAGSTPSSMSPDSAIWQILLPGAARLRQRVHLGADRRHGNRNLPMRLAGAGAGVYNATRQVGAVLGSAAIAV